MTSTVLDATVFLLCLSASVGTLIGAGPTAPGEAPDARATADRLATVTGTVTFTGSDDGDPRERQHQATLAVLLANAVVAPDTGGRGSGEPRGSTAGASGDDGDGNRTAYAEAVVDLVRDRIGPNTRVVARSRDRSAEVAVGAEPPRDADVAVAAFSVPAGPESEYVRVVVRRWSHG